MVEMTQFDCLLKCFHSECIAFILFLNRGREASRGQWEAQEMKEPLGRLGKKDHGVIMVKMDRL